jgi:hypothetical protein
MRTTHPYIDLFAKKQKFLNAVLEAKVETAKGKAIILSHEKSLMLRRPMQNLRTIMSRLILPSLVLIILWNILHQLILTMGHGTLL